MTEAAQTYHAQTTRRAVDYLVNRGLDQRAANGAQLGEVCEPALPGHEEFMGRLCIPYTTPTGVVALKFRCMEHDDCKAVGCVKYRNPSGQQERLYGVNALHGTEPYVAIHEGEIDAIVMTYMVGVPAVASPGGSWQEHWTRMFADYERVFVVRDHDVKEDGTDPGLKQAKKKMKALGSAATLITPPEGLDTNEWYQRDGADAIREALGV